MKSLLKIGIVCGTVWLSSSCTSTQSIEHGKPFAIENVSKIVEGKTTESEVIALLGEPSNRTTSSDNRVILIFHHSKTDTQRNIGFMGIGSKSEHHNTRQTVTVVLNNGIVERVSSSSGGE